MDECMPRVLRIIVKPWQIAIILTEIEYSQEHIVWEHVDYHQAYIGRVSIVQGTVQTTYVDLVLDQTLPIQNDHLSRDFQMRNPSESTSGGCKVTMTGRRQ
jgi:hypothetical protein